MVEKIKKKVLLLFDRVARVWLYLTRTEDTPLQHFSYLFDPNFIVESLD